MSSYFEISKLRGELKKQKDIVEKNRISFEREIEKYKGEVEKLRKREGANGFEMLDGVIESHKKKIVKQRRLLRKLIRSWDAYFMPDYGPNQDLRKDLLFQRWTDTVADVRRKIRDL